jgi:CheY-specific phosphatase CheX
LFESLGVQITRVTKPADAPTRTGGRLATFVGFGGNELRGALTMDLPAELVAQVHPSAVSGHMIEKLHAMHLPGGWRVQDDLCDWASELANQLLGRMKSALSKHAVTLQVSTPSTVWGEMVHAKKLRAEGSFVLDFASGEHLIVVYFDGVALVPLDLTRTPTADADDVPAEGDMLMLP